MGMGNHSIDFEVDNEIFTSNGTSLNGTYSYVIETNGTLKLGGTYQGVHYQLSNGANSVRGAGFIKLKNGRVISVNNISGHYREGNSKAHVREVLGNMEQNGIIDLETAIQGNAAVDY